MAKKYDLRAMYSKNEEEKEKEKEFLDNVPTLVSDIVEEKPKKIEKKPSKKVEERIMIGLTMTEELSLYISYKANKNGLSIQQYFVKTMNEYIKSPNPINSDLEKQYQKTQHNYYKKTILIPKSLQKEIKETAQKYGMKYTNFMTFVFDNERLKDKDYK